MGEEKTSQKAVASIKDSLHEVKEGFSEMGEDFAEIREDLVESPRPAKIAVPFKIFGVLNIVWGVALLPWLVLAALALAAYLLIPLGEYVSLSAATIITSSLDIALLMALMVLFIVMGVRLLKNERRKVSSLAYVMICLYVAQVLCSILATGLTASFIFDLVVLLYLVVLATWIDPSLSDERRLQRKLERMETRDDAEEGTLGRDETGKGYLKLDFFNLFWIFVLGCVVGLIFETGYVWVTKGVLMNRTGVLWGPFSPIYGFGALLMTMALNRFYQQNILITFGVSALIGGAFEFFVSWFLQTSFGIVAWDYTGAFMSVDGRTDLFHILAWGLLGSIWVRFLLSRMLHIINLIPWQARYGVTAVFAAFMIANCLLTLVSLDRWFERVSGVEPTLAIEQVMDERCPNEWMQQHFQTMNISPDNAIIEAR